ncbi:hypothetical protein ACRRTK_015278 [Alexandromys fortis]
MGKRESEWPGGCHKRSVRMSRMGGGGTMNMEDPYGSGGQKFPPLGGGGGIGYEANPGVPPATMSGSMMGSDMRTISSVLSEMI